MAKRTKRKGKLGAKPLFPMPMMPQIDWGAPIQDRKITKSKTTVSEYELDDGTKLTIKAVLVDVKRALKQFNQHGQPLYFCSVANTITTNAPKKLRKK